MFPRVPPGEPEPAPWDVRPQRLRSRSPRPPGTEGAGAAGAAGLRAAGAGSGIPAPQSLHAARGRSGRFFRGRSWGEGGIPCLPPPSLPSPPPPSLGGPTPLGLCLPRAPAGRNSAPPQAAPGGPGIPSVTHGTPLASPGSWGPARVRTSGSSCIPPFRATGPPPPASPTWTGCSLRPPGRGSSRSHSRGKDSPSRGVCSPSLLGTPRRTVPRPAGSSLSPRCVAFG